MVRSSATFCVCASSMRTNASSLLRGVSIQMEATTCAMSLTSSLCSSTFHGGRFLALGGEGRVLVLD